MAKIRAFDFLGNIAIVNFPDKMRKTEKIKFARKLMIQHKSIKTVLEKSGKISGRLRKAKFSHIAGEKTQEVLYRENNCVFRFNIENTYFSPRLSNERKEVASKIKKGERVLVMFAGVGPFSIVIGKNSKVEKIISNEINRQANKYAELNIELNKLKTKIELLPGDIKKVGGKVKEKFDVIVMPRPRLKETFLQEAFKLIKKNGRIFYYGFCEEGKAKEIVSQIEEEAKKARKKIKILKIKKAGEIAPYKIRVRIDFKIV